jgi:tetratricopeptide (TPR) repeat protein
LRKRIRTLLPCLSALLGAVALGASWPDVCEALERNMMAREVTCVIAGTCDDRVVTQREEQSGGTSRLLGTRYYRLGMYSDALPLLTHAWESTGNQPDILSGYFLALTYRALDLREEAAALLRRLGLVERYRDQSWREGVASQLEGDYLAAEAAYQWAMTLDPQFLDAGYQLLGLYIAWNRPEANREFIPWLLAQDCDVLSGRRWFAKGYLAILEGDWLRATPNLELSLALEPDDCIARYFLGVAVEQSGDLASAEDQYLKAIRCKRDYVWAYLHLADIYDVSGHGARAVEVVMQGLRVLPNDPLLLERLRTLEGDR